MLHIPISTLQTILQKDEHLTRRIYFNLAKQLNTRLKAINEETVEALRQKLEEAKIRISLGRFMVYTTKLKNIFVKT